jgi:hypothetical protein
VSTETQARGEREFFIQARSFAAPFVSDESTRFVTAPDARAALERFAADYKHPAGLYAAAAYASADAFHKGADPIARWLCNKEQALREATKGKAAYSVYSPGQDLLEVDGEPVVVHDPRGGSVVAS